MFGMRMLRCTFYEDVIMKEIDIVLVRNKNIFRHCQFPIFSFYTGKYEDDEKSRMVVDPNAALIISDEKNRELDIITDKYTEEILKHFIPIFNEFHGIMYSKRYWKRLLDTFKFKVFVKTCILFEYFIEKMLLDFREYTKNFKLLDKKWYRVREKDSDLVMDGYSCDSVLFAQFLSVLIEIKLKEYTGKYTIEYLDASFFSCDIEKRHIRNNSMLNHFINALRKYGAVELYYKVIGKIKHFHLTPTKVCRVLLVAPPFDDYTVLKLLQLPQVCSFTIKKGKYENVNKCNMQLRKILIKRYKTRIGKVNFCGKNDIDIIGSVFLQEMPTFLLEAFDEIKKYVSSKMLSGVRNIITTTSWSLLEYRFWMSEMAEKYNTQIIGYQHGGNYPFLYDLEDVDVLYTWGWSRYGQKKYIPAFADDGLCRNNIKHSEDVYCDKGEYILFVGTAIPAFQVFPINLCHVDPITYIHGQCEFIRNVQLPSRMNILVRDFPLDSVWHIRDILINYNGNLQFDHNNIYDERGSNIFYAIRNSNICVCDSFTTVFFQALYLKHPCLVFFAKELHDYPDTEEVYIREMQRVGLLFFSPKEAANMINSIIDDVDLWWNSEEVLEVRSMLEKHYIRSCSDCDWWYNEIISYVNG